MEDVVRLLIPLAAVSIPLVAVVGHVLVRPIVDAISKVAESQRAAQAGTGAAGDARLVRVEERMAELETQLHRMLEEQRFQRELLSSRAGSVEERGAR